MPRYLMENPLKMSIAICYAGILSACLLFFSFGTRAQHIPPGTWRVHLSYNDVRLLQVTPGKIFAATTSGILLYNAQEKSLRTYTKLDALSGTGISALGYDSQRKQLLVGYENGLLDIIGEVEARSFKRLRDADITESKAIRNITVHGDLAYLATAYGVVSFDLRQLEIKEAWRDLGEAGERLAIYQSTFHNDSVFLASANGVLAGNLRDNLLDFSNWTRFQTGGLSGPINAIVTFNNKVYASGLTGLYRFTGDGWVQEPYLQYTGIRSLSSAAESLLIIADQAVWVIDRQGNVSHIADPLIAAPAMAAQDNAGNVWISDGANGLVSNAGGTFRSYLPNGPSRNDFYKLESGNGRIFAIAGGFSEGGVPLNRPGTLNIFDNGSWSSPAVSATDLTDVALRSNQTLIASFGSGILVTDASGEVTVFDETNSPLAGAAGDARITDLAPSADGLWVASYNDDASLHLLQSGGNWESFAFAYAGADKPTRLAVDGRGNVWMALSTTGAGGLIAYDHEARREYFKTTAAGAGALPHAHVTCLAADRDGVMWVGTGAGIAWFPSATEDAIKPIYEGRFLLRNEKITAIAIDGGNRKWIGTEGGVWLFSPTGETLVHHFTTENSPLLSDSIDDIAIHPATGEVFFATHKGIVSYRSDATQAGPDFGNVRIFPNPVRPDFSGTVAVDGLASDARVRITDVSGNLVFQTQANGGMASWNVRDGHGKRVATGIYLIFAISADGSKSMVGKVAVVSY